MRAEERCAEANRDPATLETSCLLTVVVDDHLSYGDMAEALRGRAVKGSPQQVADEMKCRVLDVGVDGIIVNLPTHRYTPGVFTAVGELSRPWLRRIDVRSADAPARVTDRLAR